VKTRLLTKNDNAKCALVTDNDGHKVSLLEIFEANWKNDIILKRQRGQHLMMNRISERSSHCPGLCDNRIMDDTI